MKIAVMYIAIGAYSVMWDGFYSSAKENLFAGNSVHYFLFSDKEDLSFDKRDVTFIKSKDYGWPGNTLYRFRMFSSISSELAYFDYCYFFNANAYINKPVGLALLPAKGSDIVSVEHFNFKGRNPAWFGYERRKKSTAYVPWGQENEHFCQACLIGATSSEFIKMSRMLEQNIDEDDKNGICAKWHDEDHFNKYIIGKNATILPINYAYPSRLLTPESKDTALIIMRDKSQFGNLSVLRYKKKISFIKWCKINLNF
jgi:hypothetical protein